MAAPPPADQPGYYNAAAPGQPTYYVQPQQTGTPVQQYQQYQQPIPGTPAQQFQQPGQQFQQGIPGTPVQQYQPSPDYQQPQMLGQSFSPQPSPQQPYYAAQPPGAGPSAVVYTTTTETPQNPVITGDGTGIVGRMPQLENCCLCFPLHTGAMIIAAVMVLYYGYCGLVLVLASGYTGKHSLSIARPCCRDAPT